MTKRIENLMKKIPQGLDGAIILGAPNRRYFLDIDSSAGTLIVLRDKAFFIIDTRYIEMVKAKITGAEILLEGEVNTQIAEILKENGAKNIGVDSGYIRLAKFSSLQKAIPSAEFDMGDDVNSVINSLRKYKDAEEIKRIKEAQRITDAAFTHILGFIRPGVSEVDIALELEMHMRKNGASDKSFDTIVASGANGSKPHAVPSYKKVESGDFVTMDFGALFEGYHADMTRTIALGQISDKQNEVYETVKKAQLAALAAIKPGIEYFDVDKVARDIIGEVGFAEFFGHGLGHSVGVEIHEDPRFSVKCHEIIEENVIMTVEPGIYLPGQCGVRIEDMGAISKSGFDNFTSSTKDLIVL